MHVNYRYMYICIVLYCIYSHYATACEVLCSVACVSDLMFVKL